MHAGVLKALEFDRIIGVVCGLALTPSGAARLAELQPQTEEHGARAALAATTEAVKYLQKNPVFPLNAPPDLEDILSALAIEGRVIEPKFLLKFSDFLTSIERARLDVSQASGAFPILCTVVDNAKSFESEITNVHQKIDPSGSIVDQASPQLQTIRERLRKQRARLQGTLESYIRGKETARYLQENIITNRDGRYVLVLKTEHKGAIPGIAHGTSTSGASFFLEPLSTVETNNEIVILEENETAEIRRILLMIADRFRKRALDLHHTLQAATELDLLQAKAHFAKLVDGVEPTLTTDGRIELRGARHPLMIKEVIDKLNPGKNQPKSDGPEAQPVPIDLLLAPPTTALIITGPNTGGKTVALKTVGLLILMAQAGLHVPARSDSQLPIFRSVFSDIGDEQSITNNLSTFSWHMMNIASMDQALELPALVLLDEIGSGTDPSDGGALGIAIIEHFRQRQALVVATTHYDMLKSYASTTSGVSSAAFGFAPETFAPTYQLTYNSVGRSLALEIASQFNLPATIIASAREHRNSREAQLTEHLEKIDLDMKNLQTEQRLVASERAQITKTEALLEKKEADYRQREENLHRRLNEDLEKHLRLAQREIEEVVRNTKHRSAALDGEIKEQSRSRNSIISTGEIGNIRTEARESLKSVAEKIHHTFRPSDHRDFPSANHQQSPNVGDRVFIENFGLEGNVQLVHDLEIEVDANGKRIRVPIKDIRIIDKPTTKPESGNVSVNVQLHKENVNELNVIGLKVDEALTSTEKFLDDALLGEQRTIRVIHGHGTGRLRRALAGLLKGHAQVQRFDQAPLEEGGGGVTIIELKD